MRTLVLACVCTWAAIATDVGRAQETYFLHVNTPVDKQKYGNGASATVSGFLQYSQGKTGNKNLILRFRVFRPGEKVFVIVSEKLSDAALPSKGKSIVAFQTSLPLPSQSGQYLIRVDCLDRGIAGYPKNLVASQAVLVNVQPPKLPEAEHETVTIATPASTDSYGTGSNIATSGTSTKEAIVKIRLRLYQDSTIMQETTVNVTLGMWAGNLNNPSGGWKAGDAKLKARGLDKDGNPSDVEFDTVNLKITGGCN